MSLEFRPYGEIYQGMRMEQDQRRGGLDRLNQTLQGINSQAIQRIQDEKARKRQEMLDQILREDQDMKRRTYNYEYRDPLMTPNPTIADVPQQPSFGQRPQVDTVALWNQKYGAPQRPQIPQFNSLPNNADPFSQLSPEMQQYAQIPGAKNREAYGDVRKIFGDPKEKEAEIRLKNAQADWYQNRPTTPNSGSGSYVDIGVGADGQPIFVNNKTLETRTVPVPGGGVVYPKNVTDAQANAAGYGDRAVSAHQTIDQLFNGQLDPNSVGFAAQANNVTPNFLKSGNVQSLDQAQRNFLNAILRRESGAVISPSEFSEGKKQYFPVYGDTPETVKQKSANRSMQIENLRRSAGPLAGNGASAGGGKIRVRNRQTGQTGSISEKFFDPNKYERVQ